MNRVKTAEANIRQTIKRRNGNHEALGICRGSSRRDDGRGGRGNEHVSFGIEKDETRRQEALAKFYGYVLSTKKGASAGMTGDAPFP